MPNLLDGLFCLVRTAGLLRHLPAFYQISFAIKVKETKANTHITTCPDAPFASKPNILNSKGPSVWRKKNTTANEVLAICGNPRKTARWSLSTILKYIDSVKNNAMTMLTMNTTITIATNIIAITKPNVLRRCSWSVAV